MHVQLYDYKYEKRMRKEAEYIDYVKEVGFETVDHNQETIIYLDNSATI